jgi:hypothetical protein
LDESWFHYSTDHESIWLGPGEKVPEMTHVTISVSVQCKTLMVTIVCLWNPTGFHGIHVLPKGYKFNSSYHQSEIFDLLSEWRSGQAGVAGGTLIVHADNACPHTGTPTQQRQQQQHHITSQQFMEENRMARAPHPPSPYSPHLAPSDFYLFGYMKHCLRGQSFEAANEHFSAIERY